MWHASFYPHEEQVSSFALVEVDGDKISIVSELNDGRIIDEFSMVDTLLFQALLNGTVGVSQIILIGDDGQIPSVGAGNLLHDLLCIKEIKHISLSHIYRQTSDSSIVDIAHAFSLKSEIS